MARPGPALFELIRSGSGPQVAKPPPPAAKPVIRITAKPAEAPPAPEPEKRADKSWAAWNKDGSWLDPHRSVTVPMSAVLLAIGIVIALLVVTWATAWTIGGHKGERTATRDLKRESIPVNESLLGSSPKAPDPQVKPQPRPEVKPEVKAPPPAPGGDPRTPGFNYFLLASGLDKEGAQAIVDYLTQNGLPAASAVDKPAGGSNNRGSYVVFAAKGITPDDYKNRTAARTEIENLTARLGKAWQRDKKGQTDFSQAYWKKFAG